jgi:hypothetical protein
MLEYTQSVEVVVSMSKTAHQAEESAVPVSCDQAEEFRLLIETLSSEDRKYLLEYMKKAAGEKVLRN